MCGYYRRITQNYGLICRPLHDLLRKDNFHWLQEYTLAFEHHKQVLVTAPVLTLPNFSAPFILETDACNTGIGVVLMQGWK